MVSNIDELAEELRERLGIPDDIRLDALDLLRRMKISKVISNFEEDPKATGRDARWDCDSRTIYLSTELWHAIQATNDNDARFTVLHEVGHAVLGHTHRNRRTGGSRQFGKMVESDEQDADAFALALAVPLKFAEDAGTLDVVSLADRYGLPQSQADRRLVDLQRHMRAAAREQSKLENDSYADAMSAMRINAFKWNL